MVPAIAMADPPTAADLESAREAFHDGRELRQKGDLRGALERFKTAHAYGQTPVTALELGRTHMQLGELVEAREVFLSVARLKVMPDETEKSAAARTEAAELAEQLRARIATIVVKLSGVRSDAVAQITIDAASVPVVSLGTTRRTNPGTHLIVARADGREETRNVEVKEGETSEVAIAFGTNSPASTAITTEPQSTKAGSRRINPVTWIGLGVGAAGIAFGGVTGIIALGKASDVKTACSGTSCPPSAEHTVDSGRSAATLSTVGFAVGAAGLATAAVGFFLLSKPTSATGKGPRVVPVFAGNGFAVDGVF
ncbi:hypothetical protein AKJ09_10272 [Labilithrix luteola]|uniref:PEGA domain-containing protein n=1 Tax=Labilithrix luteola TaxID=1391654 RepID=A0A0K1QCY2_9BACT|nr:hypothetical protein AKJ09_10272 [Labilithrix luteola]